MKIYFTKHAEENLTTIHLYHNEYDRKYADHFNDEIIDFIIATLTAHPQIGHVYNKDKNLYRIIFLQRYNIYYLTHENTIFILYILDGRLFLNQKLEEIDVELPPLK